MSRICLSLFVNTPLKVCPSSPKREQWWSGELESKFREGVGLGGIKAENQRNKTLFSDVS